MKKARRKQRRSGVSAMEFSVVAALILGAVMVTVSLLGTNANTQLETTSTGVADPQELSNYFAP